MQSSRSRNMLIFLAALILFGLICLPATLFAAGADYSVGAGVALVPDYEGSDDSTGAPALFFSAQWEQGYFVKLAGNSMRGNVLPNKNWSFGPVLQFRATRDDDVDNSQVALMREIDSTVEAGAFVGFKNDAWDASLQWVSDTSDKHDGSLAKIIAGYSFRSPGLVTRLGISSTYADDDYMNTYFSVDADNSDRSGLAQYKAESEIKDVGVDVSVRYSINDNWSVMGLLGYAALLGDAKDSPVVDVAGSDNQLTAGVLAIYKF
jgi:outer membrane protein